MTDSDKIQWSESTIRELTGRLTPVEENVVDEADVAISAIQFPWPITIVSQTNVTNPDGSHSVRVVISWNDLDGATDYEVRLANLA
jgi:hypothetical protein